MDRVRDDPPRARPRTLAVAGLIGVLAFVALAFFVDWNAIAHAFANAKPEFVLLALVFNAGVFFFKTRKWMELLRAHDLRPGFWQALRVLLGGFALGLVTPARAGELGRAFLLSEKRAQALVSVVVDRLIDVLLLGAMGIVAIAGLGWQSSAQSLSLAWAAVGLGGIMALAVAGFHPRAVKRWLPLVNRIVPAHVQARSKIHADELESGVAQSWQNRRAFAKAVGWGMLGWACSIGCGLALLAAFDIRLPLALAVLAIPAIGLVDAVPVSFSGIGTRELLLVGLFSTAGISTEATVAFSLAYFAIAYILSALAGVGWNLKHFARTKTSGAT